MFIEKKIKIFLWGFMLLFLPFGVEASGLLSPDKENNTELTVLRAVLTHENGKENLFLKANYYTMNTKMAWIIPVPSKADFSLADPNVFGLFSLPGIMEKVKEGEMGRTIYNLPPINFQDISYIDAKNIYGHLEEKGFYFREGAKKYLDHYVNSNWSFVFAYYDPKAAFDSMVKVMQKYDPNVTKIDFADKLADVYLKSLGASDFDLSRHLLDEYSGLMSVANSSLLPQKLGGASNQDFLNLPGFSALALNPAVYQNKFSTDLKKAIFYFDPRFKKEMVLADLKKIDPSTESYNLSEKYLQNFNEIIKSGDNNRFSSIYFITDYLQFDDGGQEGDTFVLSDSFIEEIRNAFLGLIPDEVAAWESQIKDYFEEINNLDSYHLSGSLPPLKIVFDAKVPVFPLLLNSISQPDKSNSGNNPAYVSLAILSPQRFSVSGMNYGATVELKSDSLINGQFLKPSGQGAYFSLPSGRDYKMTNYLGEYFFGDLNEEARIMVYDSFLAEELIPTAEYLYSRTRSYFSTKLNVDIDYKLENVNNTKYLKQFFIDKGVQPSEVTRQSLDIFLTYGVDSNTKVLGAGERAAVIKSYYEAYGRFPTSQEDFTDLVLIANGRWPNKKSAVAEKKAQQQFIKIYKRIPDMADKRDEAAITVMAYGLRQKASNRNLGSEAKGISTFRSIYGHNPVTTEEWNIMQAITYSGSARSADADGDLLPDSREAKYGTDPKKKDSDGDGYTDGEEVLNGYNPKGAGKL